MLLRDFETDSDELLPRMKRWFLPQYLQLIGRLLPRGGAEGEAGGDLGSETLDRAELVAALKEALAAAEAGEGR